MELMYQFYHSFHRTSRCLYLQVHLYGDEIANTLQAITNGSSASSTAAMPVNQSVLYIANHQSTVDWVVATLNGAQAGLTDRIQFILKAVLRLTPFYGWCWGCHGFIYVQKTWQKDGERLLASLDNLQTRRSPVGA